MIKTKPLFTLIACLSATSALAQETTNDVNPWEVLIFGGIATLNGNSTLIYASDIQTDKISQTNDNDWDAWNAQLGVGYTISLSDTSASEQLVWFPALQPQVNLYYLAGDIDGYVDRFYQYDGNYSDTTYASDFKSTRLMVDLALTVVKYDDLSLFALAGVGPSWNRISYDTGVVNGAQLHLNEVSQSNFAYEFGAGLNYTLNQYVSITAEYLFTGFTNIELGNEGTEGGDRSITVSSEDFDLNAQAILLGLRLSL